MEKENSMSINAGVNLRTLRVRSGLSQEALGNRFGVCDRQIRRYEDEGIKSLDVIIEFACFFKVSVKDMLLGSL